LHAGSRSHVGNPFQKPASSFLCALYGLRVSYLNRRQRSERSGTSKPAISKCKTENLSLFPSFPSVQFFHGHIQTCFGFAKPFCFKRFMAAFLFSEETFPLARLFPPRMIFFPPMSTSFTVFVSPGSKRTAVPAGMFRRFP